MAEPGYIFTHLASAVAFLQGLDAAQLSISHDEFERGLKRCQELARREHAAGSEDEEVADRAGREALDDPYQEVPVNEIRRARQLLMRCDQGTASGGPIDSCIGSKQKPLVPNDRSLRWIRPNNPSRTDGIEQDELSFRSRYKFVAREANSLSLGEVEELLSEYKALVGMCATMIAAENAGGECQN